LFLNLLVVSVIIENLDGSQKTDVNRNICIKLKVSSRFAETRFAEIRV